MPFVVLTGEKTLADVITRAFGKLPAADAARARAALLRANPHLAGKAGLEPGGIVVIPGIPGLRAAPAGDAPNPGGDAVIDISRGLDDYRRTLSASARAERAAASDLAALVKSKEVKALVKRFPDAAGFVEGAAAAARERLVEHEAQTAFLKTLAKAQAELDELARKLG